VAIAIAAALVGALIAAPTQELVDFRFERVLEHLAGSLAHQPLQHVVWGGHRCGRRQSLILFGHGVTLLKLARVTEPVDSQREVTPLLSPFRALGRRRISTSSDNSSNFGSPWFIAGILNYGLLILAGTVAAFVTETRLVDPGKVYETMLELSEWEFKKDVIALAGDDFRANANTATRLGLVALGMALLMAAEVGSLTVWAAQTVPSIVRPAT
jgi:hypothetical protein